MKRLGSLAAEINKTDTTVWRKSHIREVAGNERRISYSILYMRGLGRLGFINQTVSLVPSKGEQGHPYFLVVLLLSES